MLPIFSSLPAEIVATARISSIPVTSRDKRLISSTTCFDAASIPRRIMTGFLPALTPRIPSLTIAWQSTVEVVVPSPALISVLDATSWISFAPVFASGSAREISFAIVTPSLTTCGAPYDFCNTTFRPRGPRVIFTAFATASIPSTSLLRALSEKVTFFDIITTDPVLLALDGTISGLPDRDPKNPEVPTKAILSPTDKTK
mmetsp:Transcript_1368/g.2128  ORF Transcript_1368/g.2128 Transcript_1368/m.2128 type:complete len:201 (-) Transcript_1368:134-736(-)